MEGKELDAIETELRQLCDRGDDLRRQMRVDLEAAGTGKERQQAIIEQYAQAQALLREEMAAIERKVRAAVDAAQDSET